MRMRLILLAILLANADGQSNNVCFVCGEGKVVTIPNAVVEIPGQPSVPCQVLSIAGLNGSFPPDQCALLPGMVGNLFGCAPVSASPTTRAPYHAGKGKGKGNSSPAEKVPSTTTPTTTVTKTPTTAQYNGKGKGK
ncbi:hypothetical protein MHU86_11699 [Fragilaria crotonensis]|nr:hypothetical protein MHU86_11676 [Fragilaria crotonensis]KAI2502795.1 hypothetical protein MHU86_11699 [Fragilaria crotonensis]